MSDESAATPDRDDPDATEGSSSGRNNEPLILALIGLGVAALLFAASALPVILSRDNEPELVTASSPSTTEVAGAESSTDSTSSSATTPPDSAPPQEDSTTTTSIAPISTPTTAPTSAEESTTSDATTPTTAPGEVAESVAVVFEGKIYLEGAVPDEATRDEIVALAAEIFTLDNVVDNYFIDERASDPSLGDIRIDDTVLFAPESSRIATEFEPLLNQGLALLTIRPATTFLIEGHTDSLGTEQYNLELSQERANSIVLWYAARGVDPSRLTAIGKGESEPIASDDTRAGRDRNRRIEVTIENLLVDPG